MYNRQCEDLCTFGDECKCQFRVLVTNDRDVIVVGNHPSRWSRVLDVGTKETSIIQEVNGKLIYCDSIHLDFVDLHAQKFLDNNWYTYDVCPRWNSYVEDFLSMEFYDDDFMDSLGPGGHLFVIEFSCYDVEECNFPVSFDSDYREVPVEPQSGLLFEEAFK